MDKSGRSAPAATSSFPWFRGGLMPAALRAGFAAKLIMIGLVLLSAIPAAAAPEGQYRLVGEHEVASELLLKPDGRFEYYLSVGALDEHSSGRWLRDGANVRLITEPKPVPPAFSQAAGSLVRGKPLSVKVVTSVGHPLAGVDLRVGFEEGEPVESYTQEYGWTLGDEEKRTPRWIELSVPMHHLRSQRFPIAIGKANQLLFVLTANDLGLIDFDNLLVEAKPGGLRLHRDGATLDYELEEKDSKP